MQRKITIDGLTYICNVSYDDWIEYWSVANANVLAEYLTQQGYEVCAVYDRECPNSVWTKRNVRKFNNKSYYLNQCEDLFEWIKDSQIGEFTNYFDKVCFHTEDGFVAAYRDDISNNWKF